MIMSESQELLRTVSDNPSETLLRERIIAKCTKSVNTPTETRAQNNISSPIDEWCLKIKRARKKAGLELGYKCLLRPQKCEPGRSPVLQKLDSWKNYLDKGEN